MEDFRAEEEKRKEMEEIERKRAELLKSRT